MANDLDEAADAIEKRPAKQGPLRRRRDANGLPVVERLVKVLDADSPPAPSERMG